MIARTPRRPSVTALLPLALLAGACTGPSEDGAIPGPTGEPPRALAAWTQAGADAARTRTSASPGPEKQPGILWSGLIDGRMATEPVLAAGAEPGRVLMGGPANLRALALSDGSELWNAEFGAAVSSAPATFPGGAWIGTLDGLGYALDTADGSQRGDFEADFPMDAPALFAAGLIVFEETSVSSRDGTCRLIALDAETLELRWIHEFIRGLGAAPASDGERVYVQASDAVFAVSLADGKPLWRWSRERQRQLHGPAVAGGRVIFHSSKRPPFGTVGALDAATGELLWLESMESRFTGSPALTAEQLIATVLADQVEARDPADGRVLWRTTLPGRTEAPPAVGPRFAYVAGVGYVSAVDRATGELAWTVEIDGEAAYLAIVSDRLLVATLSGFLHLLGSGG